jgi:hypothetical protein
VKITAGPGFSINPDTDPDAQLRRYVDEGRRQTALELAVELAKGWARADDADAVIRDAARFEAFIRDGQPATTDPAPDAELIKFLIAVRDCDVRTYAGEVSIYEKQTQASWTVSKAFARAAKRAGLVADTDGGRWVITPRGNEAIDRGQV